MNGDLIIRKATSSDIDNILSFNQKSYPQKTKIRECLSFWRSKSPDAINKNILIVDTNNFVHGQMFVSDMTYYYKGQRIDSFWEYDLIVEEELRKSAWGVDLVLYSMDLYPNSCSTGSGPQALPVHLKLGQKLLGEIKKYVGIVNPLYLFTSIHRGEINAKDFPNNVNRGEFHFEKVEVGSLPSLTVPFNQDLFEIARERDYLKWRFFSGLHEYVFYKDSLSDCYFVVRTIVKKKITALVLVDYRFDITKPESFQTILSACRTIASKLNLSIIISGSSLAVTDSVFEKYRFKSIGRPRPVLGFLKCKDRKEDIDKRNFCFITLADSDGETNW